MNSTPVSLLERLKQTEDTEAWTRFVKLYAPMLYSWASRLGMQSADSADFVQEIFAVLFRRLPEFQYDPALRFRSWLRTVALNHWRDRAKRRSLPQPIGAAEAFDGQQGADQLEQLIETEHNAFLIRQVLVLLQSEFQTSTWQAFWQVTVEDRPAAEVGKSLGLTVPAIYSAKCRVIAKLRRELAGLYY
jgi:RNA polymerase sigma-70 factor, ECF subfamily